ncbi:MAG: ATPase domain-containing protein [Nanoarchaeota archaeon]
MAKKKSKKIVEQKKFARKKVLVKKKKNIVGKKKNEKPIRAERIARLPIDINGFNSMIEGGFKKGSVNLIVGGSGSGKTIFSVQFLLDGLKKNEKCLYITFEEKKELFYENMRRFGWDLELYEKKGNFIFLEYTPEKVKTMLEEGGGEIETTILEKKIVRLAIDSITSFALLFENDLLKREAALQLFNMIRKWGCTSMLTLEEEPTSGKESAAKPLEFESDSLIYLYFERKKTERQRALEVVKMRGTDHSEELREFKIGKKGIQLGKVFSLSQI